MIPSEVKTDTVMSWTTGRTLWFPALVAAALLISCSPDPEPATELPPGVTEGSPTILPGTPAPSGTSTETPAVSLCPNEDAVASDLGRQIGTSTETDVDGDGAHDQVRLAADPSGPEGCTAFVVVELGGVEPVAAPVWEIGPQGGLPQPRFHGFVDIDGRPGSEILIDEAAGASTQFVGAFVYLDDELHRVTVEGERDSEDMAADLFAYGGSVGHVEAVDCAGEGTIVASVATPSSAQSEAAQGIYEIRRRFYVFDDEALERSEVEDHEVPIDQLNRFPEYTASPFGSC